MSCIAGCVAMYLCSEQSPNKSCEVYRCIAVECVLWLMNHKDREDCGHHLPAPSTEESPSQVRMHGGLLVRSASEIIRLVESAEHLQNNERRRPHPGDEDSG